MGDVVVGTICDDGQMVASRRGMRIKYMGYWIEEWIGG